ncbi:DsbA family protein [Campylobacter sp. faydin G-105]|uniref:DsbA family protein n=1 Tax=Campylobacter anatolicus TaxID=2829105 RepID=UPI001B9F6845|nr:DsbA family protein [Campylobacter anatolicus]MBR8462371.1 DsbA family protein [Campylobacter anatolicus]
MKIPFFTKTFKALLISTLISTSAFSFTQGVDYDILPTRIDVPTPSLTKVFNYSCVYCYRFDKSVTQKLMSKLEGVKFIPMHLDSKGKFGETTSKILASMLALDEKNGIDVFNDKSKFKQAKFTIYKSTHDKKEELSKDAFIAMALKAAKISQSEYEDALNLPRTQQILSEWANAYDIAKIQGIPAFVVNGKYIININTPQLSIDSMAELVKFLLER